MKRIAAVIAIVVTLSSCSLSQMAWYWDQVAQGNQTYADEIVHNYEAWRAEVTAGYSCPEWFDEAMSAGFTAEQWQYPLSMIMFRESRCNPNAQNGSSTAAGLTQIVVGTWRASCPDLNWADRYDGPTNLRCAYKVWLRRPNWRAWATYP